MTAMPFIIRYAQQLTTSTHSSPDSNEAYPDDAVEMESSARDTREMRVREETTDDE